MSQTMLKVRCKELDTLRVQCLDAACGAIALVPLSCVRHVFRSNECPVFASGQPWLAQRARLRLATALAVLAQARDRVHVDLVVAAPG